MEASKLIDIVYYDECLVYHYRMTLILMTIWLSILSEKKRMEIAGRINRGKCPGHAIGKQ